MHFSSLATHVRKIGLSFFVSSIFLDASTAAYIAEPSFYVSIVPELGREGRYAVSAGGQLPNALDRAFMVGPDGKTFMKRQENLTAAEVTRRFAGTWTVKNLVWSPAGTKLELHSFSLTVEQLFSFPSPPSVISPARDGPVPRIFELEWTGDLSSSGGSYKFFKLGDRKERIETTPIPGAPPVVLSFTAIATDTLNLGHMNPITVDPTYSASLQLIRRTTYKRTVFVVPEPTALTLTTISAALAALRRRK